MPEPADDLAAIHHRIETWHKAVLAPGTSRIMRISRPSRDPASGRVILCGQDHPDLVSPVRTALYAFDKARGSLEPLLTEPGNQFDPSFNPAGGRLLYRRADPTKGRTEARILDLAGGISAPVGMWEGSIEQAVWASDTAVMVLVADPGVSMASIQGATRTDGPQTDRPAWYPSIDDGRTLPRRRAALVSLDNGEAHYLGQSNIWEICPAGADRLFALASDDPREDAWYRADLRLITKDGREEIVYRPKRQVSALSVSPDGRYAAFAEGQASDRGSLAGDLVLLDLASGEAKRLDTLETDITWTGWDDGQLIAAGIRANDVLVLAARADEIRILHCLPNSNGAPKYPEFSVAPGRALEMLGVIVEPAGPESLVAIREDGVDHLWDTGTADLLDAMVLYGRDRVRAIPWTASDGLEIDGWLHTPAGEGPFPLAVLIHGGPTMRWVPKPLSENALQVALADAGFAQFMPNPRGSTGRGQDYARAILHDMGGRDMRDILDGVDHLVALGIADPNRLYVSGISHGGFMTSWIVTQDSRFNAGAAVSPITDWTSQQLTSDIPSFNDDYIGAPDDGLPSPILHAGKVGARMLMIAGARDRCTPPAQAEEFHTAVRLAGGRSTLLVYPQEGHGIRSSPAAAIDHLARIVAHFGEDAKADAEAPAVPINAIAN